MSATYEWDYDDPDAWGYTGGEGGDGSDCFKPSPLLPGEQEDCPDKTAVMNNVSTLSSTLSEGIGEIFSTYFPEYTVGLQAGDGFEIEIYCCETAVTGIYYPSVGSTVRRQIDF